MYQGSNRYIRFDFETYCEEDIDCGAWKYSCHPSIEVLCMAWALDDAPTQIWIPRKSDVPYWTSQAWIDANPDVVFEAHNISFEYSVWMNYCVPVLGWGVIPLERWRDSMAKVAAHALPLSLENAGSTLGLEVQKDTEGKRVMQQLSKPRMPSKARPETRYLPNVCEEWDEKFFTLYSYCKTDVDSQRAISKALPELSPEEQNVFLNNLKSNVRGIPVDIVSARSCLRLVDEYKQWSKVRAYEITNGELNSVLQVGALVKWLKDKGFETESVDKASVAKLLERTDLTPDVREILEIRSSIGKSSTAKIAAMVSSHDPRDNRVRFCEQYHGAGTGRVAGRILQAQNMSKPDPLIIEKAKLKYPDVTDDLTAVPYLMNDLNSRSLSEILEIYGDPMRLVSSVVRSLIQAPRGKKFIAADYSSIESRVLFWLAGQQDAVDLYAQGADIYCEMATEIFERPITKADKKERALGKACILGLGYGMGVSKFLLTCQASGLDIDEAMARKAREAYHRKFPEVPRLWRDVEDAAKKALLTREPQNILGTQCSASFDVVNKFMRITLPSGRNLSYFYPKIETEVKVIKGEEFKSRRISYVTAGINGKAMRKSTWGATLVENMCQAISRDVTFLIGVDNLEKAEYPVFMTVHDEIVSIVPENFGTEEQFCALITKETDWSKGLPLESEAWTDTRYRK